MILKALTSFFLGALLILAFEPFNLWIFSLIVPILILITLEKMNSKFSFILGYLFGFGFWLVGIFWIENSINVFGGANIFISSFLTILLSMFLSLFQGLVFFTYSFLKNDNFLSKLFLFPSLWVLSEWLREFLFSGFPWLYIGYTSIDNFFVNGFIPISGIFGMSFIIILLSSSTLELFKNIKRFNLSSLILCNLLILLICISNIFLIKVNWTTPTSEIDIVVVQPNIGIKEKWTSQGRRESTDIMGRLLIKESSRLIDKSDTPKLFFFPEVFLPGQFSNFAFYLKPFLTLTEKANIGVVAGTLSKTDENSKIYNSLISFGNLKGTYLKEKLVPFGEYVPYSFFNYFFNFFNFSRPEVSAGKNNEIIIGDGYSIFASICYEVAFQDLFYKYAPQSNLLFSASNDAWFGETIGPHQHLQIARYRAAENRKPLIRSTTSGISAVVDEKGSIIDYIKIDDERSKRNNSQEINLKLYLFEGNTPINSYGKIPVIVLLLVILVVSGYMKFRKIRENL